MVRGEERELKTRFGHPILEGWTQIADAIGKSVSTAKIYASREVDRLPVQSPDGPGCPTWAYEADLIAWAERQGWPTRPESARVGQSRPE